MNKFHPGFFCDCAKCAHQRRIIGHDIKNACREFGRVFNAERLALEDEIRLDRLRRMCDE